VEFHGWSWLFGVVIVSQGKIVGRLYPIGGDEMVIYQGEEDTIRKRMIDYIFSVDPDAYFVI
jgi:hypothetical protein